MNHRRRSVKYIVFVMSATMMLTYVSTVPLRAFLGMFKKKSAPKKPKIRKRLYPLASEPSSNGGLQGIGPVIGLPLHNAMLSNINLLTHENPKFRTGRARQTPVDQIMQDYVMRLSGIAPQVLQLARRESELANRLSKKHRDVLNNHFTAMRNRFKKEHKNGLKKYAKLERKLSKDKHFDSGIKRVPADGKIDYVLLGVFGDLTSTDNRSRSIVTYLLRSMLANGSLRFPEETINKTFGDPEGFDEDDMGLLLVYRKGYRYYLRMLYDDENVLLPSYRDMPIYEGVGDEPGFNIISAFWGELHDPEANFEDVVEVSKELNKMMQNNTISFPEDEDKHDFFDGPSGSDTGLVVIYKVGRMLYLKILARAQGGEVSGTNLKSTYLLHIFPPAEQLGQQKAQYLKYREVQIKKEAAESAAEEAQKPEKERRLKKKSQKRKKSKKSDKQDKEQVSDEIEAEGKAGSDEFEEASGEPEELT